MRIKNTWNAFNYFLTTRPLISRCIISGTIASTGDLSCQLFLEKQSLDLKRLFRAGLYGTLVSPVNLYAWYFHVFPKIQNLRILRKAKAYNVSVLSMLIEQFVLAPYSTFNFLFILQFLEVF